MRAEEGEARHALSKLAQSAIQNNNSLLNLDIVAVQ